MSELDKNKAGLQKNVSSVFKGVPVPQNTGSRQSSDSPAPKDRQNSQSSLIKKLNQPEDPSDKAEQGKTTNIFRKQDSANSKPQNPTINKLPRPKESLKQQEVVTMQPEIEVIIEESGDGFLQQIKDKLFTPKPGVSPARQKAMVIMVPVLAIVMIFVFRQVLSKSPRQTEGAGTDEAPVVVANSATGSEIEWKIPEPINIIQRDPIELPDENPDMQNNQQNQTTGEIPTEETIISIKDIVYSKDKPSAVIGSKIVYVGDMVNGATILKINRDSIEFEKDGERWIQNARDGKKIPISDGTGSDESQPSSTE